MSSTRDHVVLIHGLGRSPLAMLGLHWCLSRAGFTVLNVAYPSLQISVAQAVENFINPALANLKLEPGCISSLIRSVASSSALGQISVQWTSHSDARSCWLHRIRGVKSWIIWLNDFGFACC